MFEKKILSDVVAPNVTLFLTLSGSVQIVFFITCRSHSPRSPSKRARLENSDSNGMAGSLTPNKTSVLAQEKSPVDPNSSEHIIAINRLQEQLDNLKKQLSQKDQQLLEKEKKVVFFCQSVYF